MTEVLVSVNVVDLCVDTNAIYLGDITHPTYQDFIIKVTDPLSLSLPYVSDYATLEYSTSTGDSSAVTEPHCGAYTYSMTVNYYNTALATVPSWIEFSETALIVEVNPTDSLTTESGEYSIWITYGLAEYPDIFLTEQLVTVHVIDRCLYDNHIVVDNTAITTTETQYSFILGDSEPIYLELPSV